ncbi:hypothetical protein [Sphingobium sp. TomMM35A]
MTTIRSDEDLKAVLKGKKFVEGDCGWLFLTSDGNDQLSQQFGFQKWNDEEEARANKVVADRIKIIPSYKKFLVPEKSILYREYLPMLLKNLEDYKGRPCLQLQGAVYLIDCLEKAKPMGSLYPRGDTHPNWMGSYFLYAEICRQLNIVPLHLKQFVQTLAGFDGDLVAHMTDEERQDYLDRVHHFAFTLDSVVQLQVIVPRAVCIGDDGYDKFSRQSFVYEHENKELPKAVVFRDSTCQFMVPWLAEHFSRSVFIWHRGDVIAEVIEREKPDIVFQIMAERFVWRYPARASLS